MDDFNNQNPFANPPAAPQVVVPSQTPCQPELHQVPKRNKKPLLIGGIIAVVAIVVAVVIAFSSGDNGGKKYEEEKGASTSGASSYEDALTKYFDAVYKGKTSNIEDTLPKEVWEYYLDENEELSDEFDSTKELIAAAEENYADLYEEMIDDSDYGEFEKYDYEIEATEVSDSKLEKIAESLEDLYDIDEDDVKKAYKLKLDGEIVFEDDEIDVDGDEYYAVKIGGKWYIVGGYEDYYYFEASYFVNYAIVED